MKWLFIALLVMFAFFCGAYVESMLAEPVNYSYGVSGNVVNDNSIERIDTPASISPDHLLEMLVNSKSPERISPYNWINENQIHVLNDKIIIDIPNPEWAAFTNTNSMDPVIDEAANAIEIVPDSPDDVHLGDIVSYRKGGDTIIHRVIGKGEDSEGVFFIMKGDNNPSKDPGKIRFEQIQRIVVAIIY